MKTNKTHISLETAKLLKDCGVESKKSFSKYIEDDDYVYCDTWRPSTDKEKYEFYPAYTWQEILWENAEKFGINKKMEHGAIIVGLLQLKRYEEADKYFREHCILIKTLNQ